MMDLEDGVCPWGLGRQARVYYQNSMNASGSACSVQLIPGH